MNRHPIRHRGATYLALSVVLLCAHTAPAHAALVDTGNGLINSTTFDRTWVKDANLFQTLANSDINGPAAFVDKVIAAAGGVISDTPNQLNTPSLSGRYNLSATDFDPVSGTMTWWGAQAWVHYLNDTRFKGFTDWRLPATPPEAQVVGYEYDGADRSEFGQLVYGEFGGAEYGQAINLGAPFLNVSGGTYWSGTEYSSYPVWAWWFLPVSGLQDYVYEKNTLLFAWPVRTGLAAVVPIPGALWLLSGALVGIARFSLAGRGKSRVS